MLSTKSSNPIRIGIPIYPNFDSLDVLGPYQVFTIMGAKLFLFGPAPEDITPEFMLWWEETFKDEPGMLNPKLAAEQGFVQSFEGVKIIPDYQYAEYPDMEGVDLLFVPDARKPELPLYMGDAAHNPYLHFLKSVSAQASHVTAVCTGALLLAAAGLLDGYRATTHWAYKSVLKQFPAVDVAEGYPRFVIDGNRVTGGGISSGIDEALAIAAIVTDEATAKGIQLTIQYAPHPPFNDGDPSVAGPTVLAQTSQAMRPGVAATAQAFTIFRRQQ